MARPDLKGAARAVWRLWTRLIADTWFPEILAAILSITSTIAIAVVISVYNGKANPQLPYGITLNAVISVLGTAAKTSLGYVVASAISQLKWCWFQKKRKVYTMAFFDDASRGPWGAAIFLYDVRWRSFASIGAMVVIVSLAYDPFIQQILRYPSKDLHSTMGVVSTKRNTFFPFDSRTLSYKGAIHSAIWADSSDFDISPKCPSGNCQWQPFTSLDWCSKCGDVTSTAVVKCDGSVPKTATDKPYTCTLALGLGPSVFAYNEFWSDANAAVQQSTWPNAVWPLYSATGVSSYDFEAPIMSTQQHATVMGIEDPLLVMAYSKLDYSIENNITKVHVVSAEQCAITPCLRHYNLTTKNGVAERRPMSTNYGVIKNYNYFPIPENPPDVASCWQPNKHMIVKQEDFISSAGGYSSNTSHVSCSQNLASYASGIMDVMSKGDAWTGYPGSENTKPYNANGESLTLQRVFQTGLKHVIDNVAAAITKRALQESPESVPGYVITSQTYVSVRWEWLILPIVLEVLGLLVLSVAMLMSSRRTVPLWKASVLPLLYHGFEHGGPETAVSISNMESLAEEKIVRLDAATRTQKLLLRS